jgi:polysaccharide deacetylase family sporulation protein PdaB
MIKFRNLLNILRFPSKNIKKAVSIALYAALAALAAATGYPITSGVLAAADTPGAKLPIYCVDTSEKKAALTFDAAWDAEDTDELLKILADNGVKATFFVCGYWVDRYPEAVTKIYAAGHELGSHGDTHAHVNKLSLEQNKAEIANVRKKLNILLGIDINLFRPPYGEYNSTVLDAASASGFYSIIWDVDSLDWMNRGVESEITQVLRHKHLGNGSIILLHCGAKYTPMALGAIVEGLKQKGYELVTVSELIYKDNYYVDYEGRQKAR